MASLSAAGLLYSSNMDLEDNGRLILEVCSAFHSNESWTLQRYFVLSDCQPRGWSHLMKST